MKKPEKVSFKDGFKLFKYFVLLGEYSPCSFILIQLLSPVGLHVIESVFDQLLPDILAYTDMSALGKPMCVSLFLEQM